MPVVACGLLSTAGECASASVEVAAWPPWPCNGQSPPAVQGAAPKWSTARTNCVGLSTCHARSAGTRRGSGAAAPCTRADQGSQKWCACAHICRASIVCKDKALARYEQAARLVAAPTDPKVKAILGRPGRAERGVTSRQQAAQRRQDSRRRHAAQRRRALRHTPRLHAGADPSQHPRAPQRTAAHRLRVRSWRHGAMRWRPSATFRWTKSAVCAWTCPSRRGTGAWQAPKPSGIRRSAAGPAHLRLRRAVAGRVRVGRPQLVRRARQPRRGDCAQCPPRLDLPRDQACGGPRRCQRARGTCHGSNSLYGQHLQRRQRRPCRLAVIHASARPAASTPHRPRVMVPHRLTGRMQRHPCHPGMATKMAPSAPAQPGDVCVGGSRRSAPAVGSGCVTGWQRCCPGQ